MKTLKREIYRETPDQIFFTLNTYIKPEKVKITGKPLAKII